MSRSEAAGWTTAADVAVRVRRRWADGSLLRAAIDDDEFMPIDVPLRGPSASDLGDRFEEARAWTEALIRGSRGGRCYELTYGEIGGRHVGRSRIPARAVLPTPAHAWSLLGVEAEVGRFAAQLARTPEPARSWAIANPHKALAAEPEWDGVLAALDWIMRNRDRGAWLREITAAGADTKFIERHRGLLAGILGVPSSAGGFASALGFQTKPAVVRLRFDPRALGMPAGLTEAVLRRDELDALPAEVSEALIVENETSYLSVPVPRGGVVIWGKGFDVAAPASLSWLGEVPVRYWGDIDTHGFAILDRVRAHLPRATSVLMDAETLHAHRDRWGHEESATNAALTRLSPGETELYAALVTDRHGVAVRLEQERIDWSWVLRRLSE